jgi:8-oxo-dGTP pyrophosphatase MutT (NUDIX family)
VSQYKDVFKCAKSGLVMSEVHPGPDDAIPAATILLVRESTDGLETLMVERHANIGFAGGAMVWPGGKIEASDADESWLAYATGLAGLSPLHRAARVAAVREAFEETGLLLASVGGEPIGPLDPDLTRQRGPIDRDASLFLPLIRSLGARLETQALQPFARWIPPPALHKRFDTHFFIARAPHGQTPVQDGTEAMDIVWIKPATALADLAAGRRKIIFPTARNLELLGVAPDVETAFAQAAARPQDAIVQPVIHDGVLRIRDDLGYPVTCEPLSSALRG